MRLAAMLFVAGLGACSLAYSDRLSRLDDDTSTEAGAGTDATLLDTGTGGAEGGAPGDAAPAYDAGTCEGGTCVGIELAGGLGAPGAISVDNANVYFVEEASTPMHVRYCAIANCANTLDEFHTTTSTSGVAGFSGMHAFWADVDAGTIVRCITGRCESAPTVIARGQTKPAGPFGDRHSIFWSSDGTIRGFDYGGNNVYDVATAQGPVVFIAAEEGKVVWSTESHVAACNASAPCGSSPIVLGPSAPHSPVAIANETAFWLQSNGDVVSCSRLGCGNRPRLIVPSTGASNVVSDGVHVYWRDERIHGILRCTVSGCTGAPELVVRDAPSTRAGAGMALRDDWLYFTTPTSIARVHK